MTEKALRTLRIDLELWREFKRVANELGMTASGALVLMIKKFIKNKGAI